MQIDMSGMTHEEVEAIRRKWVKNFRKYPETNTVFLPCLGSMPIMYYSPKRPTLALRLLCRIIGAQLYYLPDRQPIGTLKVDGDNVTVEPNDNWPAGPENEQQAESDTGGKANRLTEDAQKARTYPYIDHINPHWVNLF